MPFQSTLISNCSDSDSESSTDSPPSASPQPPAPELMPPPPPPPPAKKTPVKKSPVKKAPQTPPKKPQAKVKKSDSDAENKPAPELVRKLTRSANTRKSKHLTGMVAVIYLDTHLSSLILVCIFLFLQLYSRPPKRPTALIRMATANDPRPKVQIRNRRRMRKT